MRLSSISFTHGSTATFALAVAGYAAVRLAGYDVPHLPGHQGMPAPPNIKHVPVTDQPPSRSAQQATGFVDDKTRHPTIGDELRTDAAAVTLRSVARPIESAAASVDWARDTQEWREDPATGEERDPEQSDTAPDDDPAGGDPSPGTTSSDPDDSDDPAGGTTTDEEEATASSPDIIADSDDEPDDR